jgi:peroxiredoxin
MPEGVGTNAGDMAPAFTLKSATGGEHSLESYRGDKNLVVIFYRAFW